MDQEAGTKGAILQWAQVVVVNMQDTREARFIWDEEKQCNKLPLQRWPATLGVLMDYCKIQEEADLPKLWLVLAKSNKKPDLVFIQDLVNQYAMELSQYYCIAPIISP